MLVDPGDGLGGPHILGLVGSGRGPWLGWWVTEGVLEEVASGLGRGQGVPTCQTLGKYLLLSSVFTILQRTLQTWDPDLTPAQKPRVPTASPVTHGIHGEPIELRRGLGSVCQ